MLSLLLVILIVVLLNENDEGRLFEPQTSGLGANSLWLRTLIEGAHRPN